MAYIISKKSKKGGFERKLYYIARAYREMPERRKPKRRILFSLGLSPDLDTALHWRVCQASVIQDKFEELEKNLMLASKGMLPNLMHYPPNIQMGIVVRDMSLVQEELDKMKLKIKELMQWREEFPECCSARTIPS